MPRRPVLVTRAMFARAPELPATNGNRRPQDLRPPVSERFELI
jgi:hypothetical protein